MRRGFAQGLRPRTPGSGLVGLALALFLAAPPALAAPTSLDAAAADSLYKDGVALMKQGKYDVACPKLIESERLDPGGGTLVAIALCHEGQGRLATAVGDWDAALTQARTDHNAMREQAARDHLASLRPRLTSIRIAVPYPAPGMHVTRDGEAVGDAQYGTALPVDPGMHAIEATAPGRTGWKTTVTAQGDGVVVDVAVPPLVEAGAATPPPATPPTETPTTTPQTTTPVAPPPAETASPPRGGGSSKKTIGFVVGGVGVASLVAGTVFGILAATDWNAVTAPSVCPNAVCHNPSDVSRGPPVNTEATLSDVFLGVGIVAAGVGAYLIFTAPKSPPPATAVQVVPLVGAHDLGLSARASF